MRKPSQVVFKNGKLYKGSRVVGKQSKGYADLVVKYVCGQIAQTKSLEEILPVESSDSLPDIMTFMEMVESKQSLLQLYNKARKARYTLLSEQLVGAVRKYQQDPSPENADVLKAIQAARVYLEKGGVSHDAVTIEVTSVIPAGFWEQSDWAQESTKKAAKDD